MAEIPDRIALRFTGQYSGNGFGYGPSRTSNRPPGSQQSVRRSKVTGKDRPFSRGNIALTKWQAKILPLRLYVDQDALDFLKKFFSFKDSEAEDTPTPEPSDDGIYFRKQNELLFDVISFYKSQQ